MSAPQAQDEEYPDAICTRCGGPVFRQLTLEGAHRFSSDCIAYLLELRRMQREHESPHAD